MGILGDGVGVFCISENNSEDRNCHWDFDKMIDIMHRS